MRMGFADRNSLGQRFRTVVVLLGNLYFYSSIHLSVSFSDIYRLDEFSLMNWLLKMFRMHKLMGSTCLVEKDSLLEF